MFWKETVGSGLLFQIKAALKFNASQGSQATGCLSVGSNIERLQVQSWWELKMTKSRIKLEEIPSKKGF